MFLGLQKAETAANEKNRASVVAINAEIRRTKARLLEEVPKLQRLAVRKVWFCLFDFLFFELIWFVMVVKLADELYGIWILLCF